MTSENTIFKFQDGYILLEDLEDWFSNGFVTPEDRIRIFEGRRSASYQISSLIHIYGDQFPFRRRPRIFEFDPLGGYSSACDTDNESVHYDITAPSGSGPKISMSQLQDKLTLADKNDPDYRDYPLLNVNNEPDGDRITGQDVIDEMERLNVAFPRNKWIKYDARYFHFLFRKTSNNKGNVPFICRLCKFRPYDGYVPFINHLFSKEHIRRLSEHQISKSSFRFWEVHFEKCVRLAGAFDIRMDTVPLLNSSADGKQEKLAPSEIVKLTDLFSKLEEKDVMSNECYISVFLNSMELPQFCQVCQVDMPKYIYDYVKHILSEQHLTSLTGVSEREHHFWTIVLKLETTPPSVEENKAKKLTWNISPFTTVPLFSSNVSEDRKTLEPSEIALLIELYSKNNPCYDYSYLSRLNYFVILPKYCDVCKMEMSEDMSIITEHVLSETHLKSLTGVANKEFNFWVNLLTIEERAKSVKDKKSIFTHRNYTPLPLIDFFLESMLLEESARNEKIEELQKLFEAIDKEFWIKNPDVLMSKIKLPWQESGCVACNITPKSFTTQLKFLEHLFSAKHVEYLVQFGFSEEAYKWWKMVFEGLAQPFTFSCKHCGTEGNPMVFKTNEEVFQHIISLEHVQKVSQKMSDQDKEYWIDGKEMWYDQGEELNAVTVMNKIFQITSGASLSPSPSELSIEREEENKQKPFTYIDWPLYHVDNEPDEDRITGQDVIVELEKLKKLFSLRKWPDTYTTYFFFLNRKITQGNTEEVAICRLCNITPFSPKLFFQHLFTQAHIQRLSMCSVSKKSFEFWSNHFENCIWKFNGKIVEKPGSEEPKKSLPEINSTFKNIPLCFSNVSNEKATLESSEISLLVDLCNRFHHGRLRGDDNYLSRCYHSFPTLPHRCEVCNDSIPTSTYKRTRHILSEKHLKSLTGVSQKEYNFWVNVMNLEVAEVNQLDMVRILTMKNTPPIPLIDYKIESTLIEHTLQRREKLLELNSAFGSIKKEDWIEKFSVITALNGNKDFICYACSDAENIVKSRYSELLDHIFSEKHEKYLIQYGFSEKAFLWWKKWLDDVANQISAESLTKSKSLTQNAPVSNVQPSSSKSSIASTSKDSVKSTTKKKKSGDDRRIPLLHRPSENTKRCRQNIFVMSFRTMVDSLQKSGKEVARKRVVDWKCEYCGSDKFGTELAAFHHITSQKHKEAMKFAAPIEDLQFWKDWVDRMNNQAEVDGSQISEAVVEVPEGLEVPEVSGTPEAPEAPKVSPYSSRAPMLDQLPPNAKVSTKTKIYTVLKKSMRSNKDWNEYQVQKASAMRVSWKCTYCTDGEKPVNLANKLYAFRHVISHRHLEKMNFTASMADLNYWKDWAENITSDRGEIVETSIQNNPRVPLLDQIPPNVQPVTEQKFNEILDKSREVFFNGGKRMQSAKKMIVDWKCTYCTDSTKKVHLSNQLDTFLHVTSEKHREKMQLKASNADLNFWKHWAEDILEQQQQTKQQKSEPSKCQTNNPRIPLLDVPRNITNLLSNGDYKQKYDSIREKMKTLKSSKETDQKVNCVCYHCPGTPQLTTIYEVMQHVFDGKHDQNIKYMANASDFPYFEGLMKTMTPATSAPVIPKEPPVVTSSAPLIASSVINSGSQQSTTSRSPTTPSTSGLVVAKEVVVPKSSSVPTKSSSGTVLPTTSKLPTTPSTSGSVAAKITQPSTPSTSGTVAANRTPVGVVLVPVRSPIVRASTNISSTPVPQASVAPEQRRTVSVVKPLQGVTSTSNRFVPQGGISYEPTDCMLPLFLSNNPNRKLSDTTCYGPTNFMIEFISRLKIRFNTRFFITPTKCGLCNVDMTSYQILHVANHVFSVRHLEKFKKAAGCLYYADFDWWTRELTLSEDVIVSYAQSNQCEIGFLGVNAITYHTNSPIFQKFSNEQAQLISNIDETKVRAFQSSLLRKFSGCLHCNKWLLTGMDIIHHYVSEQHFAKVRENGHTVRMADMEIIMAYIQNCQQEKSKCTIM